LYDLIESWVEVNSLQSTLGTPVHLLGKGGTQSFHSMEKLLWEAQKESNQSSIGGSGRNSHSISPKSAQSPVYPIESISPIESILLSKVSIKSYSINRFNPRFRSIRF
jgi:hypothetical protein